MDPQPNNAPVSLLLKISETFREIARCLRSDGATGEAKHFYTSVMAYCLLIRTHMTRIRLAISDTDQLVTDILIRLEATVKTCIFETQPKSIKTAYPRLTALNAAWERTRYDGNVDEQQSILRSIELGLNPNERNSLIEFFEDWEDDVKKKYPDDPALWTQGDFALQTHNRGQPSHAVWTAPRSLFQALLESKPCECDPGHDFGVRLCLGTFQTPDVEVPTSRLCGFEMFLSMKQEWHEADVHFAKGTAIKFGQNELPAGQKQKLPAMKIRKLCEPIKKRKPSDRLKLRVDENGSLWKLRSEKCCFTLDEKKAPISLQQFIQDQHRSLTDKTKRIMAVILSYAVLYLHGTPWLPDTWGPSSILFFHTTSSAIPLKPFIQTKLPRDGLDISHMDDSMDKHVETLDPDDMEPDDFDPDDLDPDDMVLHQCPQIVTLGIMLMELYLTTTFEDLAMKYNIPLDDRTRSIDAEMVFQQCKSEIPENSQFHYAVEKCLDPKVWEDENGSKLDDQMLRTTIYQQVVKPLEDELIQAFSYINIEELDRIAQTLDLGAWGQAISTHHHGSLLSEVPGNALPKSSSYEMLPVHNPQKQQQQYFALLQGSAQLNGLPVMPIFPSFPHITPVQQGQNVGEIDYNGMKFFDDETISEEHSVEARTNYSNWRFRFKQAYERYITQAPKSPVRIAILDTGIDQTHPDVDAGVEQIKGQYNWTNEKFPSLVDDYNGHGTFIASLFLEYAPDAEIYIAKISDGKPSSPSIIAKAVNHAVQEWKCDIISMSFGFYSRDIEGYDELESAIHNAYSAHVLVFAAASNSGANLDRAYPARDDNIICINSTDANGNRSPFSPTALSDAINLATVGEAVESAWPLRLCDASESGLKHKSGTSYATPIAAAIAAFLLQYVRLYLPEHAHMFKRPPRMKSVLRKISQRSSKDRDGYQFIAVSCYSDNLFGKEQEFINYTLRDMLSQ